MDKLVEHPALKQSGANTKSFIMKFFPDLVLSFAKARWKREMEMLDDISSYEYGNFVHLVDTGAALVRVLITVAV